MAYVVNCHPFVTWTRQRQWREMLVLTCIHGEVYPGSTTAERCGLCRPAMRVPDSHTTHTDGILRVRLGDNITGDDPSNGECSNTNLGNNGTLASSACRHRKSRFRHVDVSGRHFRTFRKSTLQHAAWLDHRAPTTRIYFKDGGTTADQAAPGGIGELDPNPANQAPNADANVPSNGTAGVPVQFDGSGSFDPDGRIVSYSCRTSVMVTIAQGVTSVVHLCAPMTDTDVSLLVMDDVGAMDTDEATATIGTQDTDGDVVNG